MTTAILVFIAIMWIPVGLFLLGKGEPKGTGYITGAVGALVVITAIVQATFFKDVWTAGLLFAHGLLYLTTSFALLAGLEDLRSVGNVSLTVCLISLVYTLVWAIGTDILPRVNPWGSTGTVVGFLVRRSSHRLRKPV